MVVLQGFDAKDYVRSVCDRPYDYHIEQRRGFTGWFIQRKGDQSWNYIERTELSGDRALRFALDGILQNQRGEI